MTDSQLCIFVCLRAQRVWTRITVMSQDPVAAKKRLTSRTTRYSGVLDLLHFQEVRRSLIISTNIQTSTTKGRRIE